MEGGVRLGSAFAPTQLPLDRTFGEEPPAQRLAGQLEHRDAFTVALEQIRVGLDVDSQDPERVAAGDRFGDGPGLVAERAVPLREEVKRAFRPLVHVSARRRRAPLGLLDSISIGSIDSIPIDSIVWRMRRPNRLARVLWPLALCAASATWAACAKLDTTPNVAMIEGTQAEEERFVESQFTGEDPAGDDRAKYDACRDQARAEAETIAGVPGSGTAYASAFATAYEAARRRCLAGESESDPR